MTLQGKGDFAGVIKLKISRGETILDDAGGPKVITKVLRSERQAMHMALKIEKRATTQDMQAASRSWKRPGMRSSLGAPRESMALQTPRV